MEKLYLILADEMIIKKRVKLKRYQILKNCYIIEIASNWDMYIDEIRKEQLQRWTTRKQKRTSTGLKHYQRRTIKYF